jgi:hypothetical protein
MASPHETAAIVQRTVIEGKAPALTVIHDDEGDWLVCDGVTDPNVPGASGLFHMSHVVALDPTVAETATLPLGSVARRTTVSSPWTYSEFDYDD